MSKILLQLTQFILVILAIFFFSIFLPKTVLAANCTFKYFPDPPNQNMDDLSVIINSNELSSGTYRVYLTRPNRSIDNRIVNIAFTSGTETTITLKKATDTGWLSGTYKLEFVDMNERTNACETNFKIADIPVSSCIATIETKPIDPDTDVILLVKGIKSDSYDIFINDIHKFTNDIADGSRLKLGKFPFGNYIVTIKSRCGVLGLDCAINPARTQCSSESFAVALAGSKGGGRLDTTPSAAPLTDICKKDPDKCAKAGGESCSNDPKNPGFKTAIGCIHTNPAALVKDILTFAVAISGGLAFLMMLLGAYQMLASSGNPETLTAGKDRMTNAIIGLLFVIFSVLLMQIIGFDILKIPGFDR